MARAIRIFIEFELTGDIEEFEAIFREIVALSRASGGELDYDFYRDPLHPKRIFALESHPDAGSLAGHFERSFPLLQKAWACARPVQTVILGEVPPALRTQLEQSGVIVTPWWMGNG